MFISSQKGGCKLYHVKLFLPTSDLGQLLYYSNQCLKIMDMRNSHNNLKNLKQKTKKKELETVWQQSVSFAADRPKFSTLSLLVY